MRQLSFSFCLLLATFYAQAQSFWSPMAESDIRSSGPRYIIPSTYRTMRLDVAGLTRQLAKSEAEGGTWTLVLPMPDGRNQSFDLWENSVMEPELQARYPDIRCYTGRGTDNAALTLKCDWTPWGFHAMILSSLDGETVFIDPYAQGDVDNYLIYRKKDYLPHKNRPALACAHEEASRAEIHLHDRRAKTKTARQNTSENANGGVLRRYRLALACTGEYASFHGGTKALVLAAMNTTMNRVNGVYERDLSVTMRLVAKNDTLVFLNAASDPYTNTNETAMLTQNVSTCNLRIGSANYDIGHVFGKGAGGIASLGVVCTPSKARGVTGNDQPIGDPFDIDYVSHEMGHQFGAEHTFNGTEAACNGNAAFNSEIEPGSGSTIMSYAGICGSQNIQNNSSDYFHVLSLLQIGFFITQDDGDLCPVKVPLNNQDPAVSVGPNQFIPRSTPFTLTAVGTDVDGDTLSYCWEQGDLGVAPSPPVSNSTVGPLFRSFPPTSSPSRTFPRLQDILNNATPTWEKLPSVARKLNFLCTIRDNNKGGGSTSEALQTLEVVGTAGPFLVTQPNTNVTWTVGETRNITWDVAKTDLAPIACARVRILLSTNGGQVFDRVLVANTANDGSVDIIVPDAVSNTCRVKVEAIGNVFFDLSNSNFRIQQVAAPSFLMSTTDLELRQTCANDTLSIPLTFSKLLNFNGLIKLSASGLPAGAQAVFSPDTLVPDGNSNLNITGLVAASDFTLTILATSGNIQRNIVLPVKVLPATPETVQQALRPANGSSGVGLSTVLKWQNAPSANLYFVEIALNPAFKSGSVLGSATTNADSILVQNLQAATVYYWRVRSENPCSQGAFSPVFAFQTANSVCNQVFNSSNVPLEIADFKLDTITSSLAITDTRDIQDVNVSVKINHSWAGDVAAQLIAPGGVVYTLWDRPGVPADEFGCGGADIDLVMDDSSVKTAADLEVFCDENVAPALKGTFQPIDKLSALAGKKATGTWRLRITDGYEEDGGALTAWGLTFCFGQPNLVAKLLKNNVLTLQSGETKPIDNALLQMETSANAAQGRFTLLTLPLHGKLSLNGTALLLGDTFAQADIDAGKLAYAHDAADTAKTDFFRFDVFDANNTAWLPNSVFNINILSNNLIVNALAAQQVKCFNGSDGIIKATAAGGKTPYQYSLNGGAFQNGDTFSGLAAGIYTITVKDADGFTKEAAALTLANPAELKITASTSFNNITANATGGTGALTYSLNGGASQSSGVFQNLANATYTLTASDANGCTASTTATIFVNTLTINALTVEQVRCFNGSDGIIKAEVSGGKTPYQYNLNGGAFQNSDTFGGLAAGIYTITVKDADGFTKEAAALTLINPAELKITATATLNSITANATGGTGALAYSLNGGAFQSSGVFQNLANATYTLTARDAKGCTASASATVAVNTLSINVLATQVIKCFNGKGGAIMATAAGGKTPYQYSLNGGAFQNGDTFGGLAAGIYTVTVKDADGFTKEAAALALANPAELKITATATLNSITANATGGTGALAYSLNGGAFQSSGVFQNLANASYTLTARDANGCTASTTAEVKVPPLTTLFVGVNFITCHGGNSGEIQVLVVGGVPPYTYTLNGGAETKDSLFTGLNAGPHNIVVKDAAGNLLTINNVKVPQPNKMEINITVKGNDIGLLISGNTAPYTYDIKGIGTQTKDLPNGMYSMVVTDVNGCSGTAEFVINYTPPQFGPQQTVQRTGVCEDIYDVRLQVEDGLPPFLFSRDGVNYQPDPEFKNLPVGTFTFYLKDDAGSTDTIAITLADEPDLQAVAQTNGDSIAVLVSQGVGPFLYSVDSLKFQDSPLFPDLPNGTYRVWVKDDFGCVIVIENVKVLSQTIDVVALWGLRVSPNPSEGLFRLQIQNAPKQLYIKVLDAFGREVFASDWPAGEGGFEHWLDLRQLPSGPYWMQVSDGERWGGVKLLRW